MGNRDRANDRIAQDTKLTGRSDSYGPMPGEQIKARPPAPAPIVKTQSGSAQPTTTGQKSTKD
jgi:hypothetical protein